MSTSNRPGVEENPFAGYSERTTTPEQSLDLYRDHRATCPVAHSTEFEGFDILLGYDDVRSAMADWETFSSTPSALRPLTTVGPFPPLDYDPPDQGKLRNIAKAVLNPRTPRAIEPAVQADIDACIDSFAHRGSCDLVAELAEPIPLLALCHAFGLSRESAQQISELTEVQFAARGTAEEAPANDRFRDFVRQEVQDRRDHPRDDGLTRLLNSTIDDASISEDLLIRTVVSLLGAGHQSTTSAIANAFDEILSRPELCEMLRSDPDRTPEAVEEILRLRPSFFGFYRRTTREVTIAGTTIPPNRTVMMGWASANRDSEQFPDPEELVVGRKNNRHLSFGYGVHSCMGSAVARMELRLVINTVLRRLPDIQLASGGRGDYKFASQGNRGYLTRLNTTFTPQPVTGQDKRQKDDQ